MISFMKTRRSLPTPSPTTTEAPAPRAGLKPLRLVEKLVAARVIDRLLPKTRRSASKDSHSAPKGSKPPPTQTATVQQRAPFVVPLRVSDTGRGAPERRTPARHVSMAAVRRPLQPVKENAAPKPAAASRIPKRSSGRPFKENTVAKSATVVVSRLPKPRADFTPRPRVAAKTGKKVLASSRLLVSVAPSVNVSSRPRTNGPASTPQLPRRSLRVRPAIPVFVGRASVDPFSAPTPRSTRPSQATPSRIPRFKHTVSPWVSPAVGSVLNAGLQTPCPSYIARKVLVPKATKVDARACVKTLEVKAAGKNKTQVVEGSKSVEVGVVGDKGKSVKGEDPCKKIVQEAAAPTQDESKVEPEQEDVSDHRVPSPAAAKSTPDGQDTSTPGGVMETLIGHLKKRLSLPTKSAASTPTPPSPIGGAFIMVPKPARRPVQETTEGPSELHQAFARRAAALSKLASNVSVEHAATKEFRRPLAPLKGFVNMLGRRGSPPTAGIPPYAPAPDLAQLHVALSPISVSNDDGAQPGADFSVTEIVSTPFGTRRVRRALVPPMAEGALPSRDPQIVMELNRLRAQQKVGGVGA